MSNFKPSNIAEHYATIVAEYPDGEITLTSFHYGTSAVRCMVELSQSTKLLNVKEGLYATEQYHAGYLNSRSETVSEAEGL